MQSSPDQFHIVCNAKLSLSIYPKQKHIEWGRIGVKRDFFLTSTQQNKTKKEEELICLQDEKKSTFRVPYI